MDFNGTYFQGSPLIVVCVRKFSNVLNTCGTTILVFDKEFLYQDPCIEKILFLKGFPWIFLSDCWHWHLAFFHNDFLGYHYEFLKLIFMDRGYYVFLRTRGFFKAFFLKYLFFWICDKLLSWIFNRLLSKTRANIFKDAGVIIGNLSKHSSCYHKFQEQRIFESYF